MNLPERRNPQAETSDAKPGIRPRPIQTRRPGDETPKGPGVLHFSCPACLAMMSAQRGLGIVPCPSCEARVMPPQVVGESAGKGHQPPPTKTGRLK